MMTSQISEDPTEIKNLKLLEDVIDDLLLPKLRVESAPLSWPRGIRICYLSAPDERMAPLLESSRVMPRNVLVALSDKSLERRGDELFLRSGVFAEAGDQLVFSRFEPALACTYFANFFTKAASYGQHDEGVALEQGLSIPRSSSQQLEHLTNDKLYSRLVMAQRRIACPATVALVFQPQRRYPQAPGGQFRVLALRERRLSNAALAPLVEQFLDRVDPFERACVVKPSGWQWMESKGVKVFTRGATAASVLAHAEALLPQLQPGDAILIEEFLRTMPSQMCTSQTQLAVSGLVRPGAVQPNKQAVVQLAEVQERLQEEQIAADEADGAVDGDEVVLEEIEVDANRVKVSPSPAGARPRAVAGEPLAFRLRAIVVRDVLGGGATLAAFVAGVGRDDGPLNGTNTFPTSLECVLSQWGMRSGKAARLRRLLQAEAEGVLGALIEHEERLPAEARGGASAQTDVIGIDFIATVRGTAIVPYVIEVNDHDCLFAAQQLEQVLPRLRGGCISAWLRVAAARSQAHLLRGLRLLAVGGGGVSKQIFWRALRRDGVEVTIVDHNADTPAAALVARLVHVPGMDDHSDDAALAGRVLAKLPDAGRGFDGVLTFWEDCTVLTAELSSRLGLHWNAVEAQKTAKNKRLTMECLERPRRGLRSGYLPPPAQFAIKMRPIAAEWTDGAEISERTGVPLPALIKLEYGSSAVGVKLVCDADELTAELAKMRAELHVESDRPGCGLSFGQNISLTEFVDGSEHDIDIVLFEGEVLFACVTDNGVTRLPFFYETTAALPTQLHEDRRLALIYAAHSILRGAGFRSGVYNVEMKLTSTGPKLLEINARNGGFYIQPYVNHVYGVDLVHCAALIACGIKPIVPRDPDPKCYIVCMQLYPSEHAEACLTLETQETPKNVLWTPFESRETIVHEAERHRAARAVAEAAPDAPQEEEEEIEESLGNVGCMGVSTEAAANRLRDVLALIRADAHSKLHSDFLLDTLLAIKSHPDAVWWQDGSPKYLVL